MTRLPAEEAHVWWWPTQERIAPEDLALLGTDEFHRALCLLQEADAAAFTGTRAGVRRAVGALLGMPAERIGIDHHACGRCRSRSHGPPRLTGPAAGLALSMSRTARCAAAAVAPDGRIGIDVEALRPVRTALLADSALTESERRHVLALAPGPARDAAFHRCWTRKEAVVKASGVGLAGTELTRLEVHPERWGPLRVRHVFEGRATAWLVQDLPLSPALAAALARPATAQGPVRLHPPVDAEVRVPVQSL
ncbi:4'-phosphopantetheinyl transferase family protein [Streptomyces boninensis]|uniref:4'-phosphopantetheinyl transferase family protein n=1 Tax=Streptomyces boninensis TaxID=2039455 RepID=UPI003B223804